MRAQWPAMEGSTLRRVHHIKTYARLCTGTYDGEHSRMEIPVVPRKGLSEVRLT